MSGSRKQRRSLTTVATDAPITTGGDAAAAAQLARALAAARTDGGVADALTHRFHSYPARMHPATARALVELVLEGRARRRPPVVLDPFCGSGTVLVEARWRGARARGVDANPLAVLIARAKTAAGRPAQRAKLRDRAVAIASAVITAGKQARRAGGLARPLRTPRGADAAHRQRELTHWFAPHVRRELEALAAAIDREDAATRPVLTAVLSSILYKVSRRESDTTATQVDRKVARGAAARLFERRTEELVAGLDELAAVQGPHVGVALGDARHLDRVDIAPRSVAAVVTSPPYAGTYDYRDHQRLRFAFLGMGASRFERVELGARRRFRGGAEVARRALARWERDVSSVLREIERVLVRGGALALVTGDSMAGGRVVLADELLARCAPAGLEQVAIASQGRTLYGAAEQRAFARRPKREHIVLFRKR